MPFERRPAVPVAYEAVSLIVWGRLYGVMGRAEDVCKRLGLRSRLHAASPSGFIESFPDTL